MYIPSLIIEITRRCNMNCYHCLRGDAENIDIDDSILITLFQKLKNYRVSCITLTGGEPSIVPAKINKILSLAKKYRVEIDNFYIATNGKDIKKNFIKVLLDLYLYCSDNEGSAVNFSNDQYHNLDENDTGIKLLSLLKFVSPKYDQSPREENLLREGKASINTCASRNVSIDKFEIYNDTINDGLFYINCKGNVFSICDLSYESQEFPELIMGNVTEKSFDFLEAAIEFNNKIEKLGFKNVDEIRYKDEFIS